VRMQHERHRMARWPRDGSNRETDRSPEVPHRPSAEWAHSAAAQSAVWCGARQRRPASGPRPPPRDELLDDRLAPWTQRVTRRSRRQPLHAGDTDPRSPQASPSSTVRPASWIWRILDRLARLGSHCRGRRPRESAVPSAPRKHGGLRGAQSVRSPAIDDVRRFIDASEQRLERPRDVLRAEIRKGGDSRQPGHGAVLFQDLSQ
jgi:hypothetical protein